MARMSFGRKGNAVATRLPYGARTVAEMARNQARLGEQWQEIPRTWDERMGYVSPPVPLLPIVCTVGMIAAVFGVVFLLDRLWY